MRALHGVNDLPEIYASHSSALVHVPMTFKTTDWTPAAGWVPALFPETTPNPTKATLSTNQSTEVKRHQEQIMYITNGGANNVKSFRGFSFGFLFGLKAV